MAKLTYLLKRKNLYQRPTTERWTSVSDSVLINKVDVTRTIHDNIYYFQIYLNYPDYNKNGLKSKKAKIARLYGHYDKDNKIVYLNDLEKIFHISVKRGKRFSLDFSYPKDLIDSISNLDLRLCIGTTKSCYPTPNLMIASP